MKHWRRFAALTIIALFVIESLFGALDDAQTSDESVTIASGYAFLRTGRVVINPEHPMLAKTLIAAPLLALRPKLELGTDSWRRGEQWLAAYEFLWENRVPGRRLVFAARLPVIFASALLLLLVFMTARRLYGQAAGLLAILIAATSPELLSHGHLATLDIPLALTATITLLSFLRFAAHPTRARHIALSIACGVMLATKISSVQVLPALALAGLVRCCLDPDLASRGSIVSPFKTAWLASIYVLLGGLAVATVYGIAILSVTYLGSPHLFLDQGLLRNAWLSGYGHPTYLLGETSNTGFRHYYLVAIAAKWPVTSLLLLTLALVWWPRVDRALRRTELTLLTFSAAFIAAASFAPAQTGIRYLLPVYPALFILMGRLAQINARPRLRTLAAMTLFGSYALTIANARPHYLSYFNELVGSPRRALAILADSNLDWGQDLDRLGTYLQSVGNPPVRLSYFGNAPPEAIGIDYQALPASGPILSPPSRLLDIESPDLVCISANNLLGLFFNRDIYSWLRAREPDAVIGSIWVYDLHGDADAHRQLAVTYAQYGWVRSAEHEWNLAGRSAGN